MSTRLIAHILAGPNSATLSCFSDFIKFTTHVLMVILFSKIIFLKFSNYFALFLATLLAYSTVYECNLLAFDL